MNGRHVWSRRLAIRLAPRPTGPTLPTGTEFKATTLFFGPRGDARGAHVALELPYGDFGSVYPKAGKYHYFANLGERVRHENRDAQDGVFHRNPFQSHDTLNLKNAKKPATTHPAHTTDQRQSRDCANHKKTDRSPFFNLSRSAYFFFSISFLQSAFILSSALAASILAHFSVISAFSLSDMAPPWEPAKAATEAIEKAAAKSIDSSLVIFNILRIN
jgi:hypothetical protein